MAVVRRLRPRKELNEWGEGRDWDNCDEKIFPMCQIGGNHMLTSERNELVKSKFYNQTQSVTDAYLTIFEPDADIIPTDKVIVEDTGLEYVVTSMGASDSNVFTGWKPTTVCSISRWNFGASA